MHCRYQHDLVPWRDCQQVAIKAKQSVMRSAFFDFAPIIDNGQAHQNKHETTPRNKKSLCRCTRFVLGFIFWNSGASSLQ
jgi:hypothetical protein